MECSLNIGLLVLIFLGVAGCVPHPLPWGDSPGPRPPVVQAEAPKPASVAVPKPPPPVIHPVENRVVRRIVVDPGHGGKDPGAVGPRGTEEKAINLLMAQELAEVLRARDYEVLLTRTDDTFIPLGAASWPTITKPICLFLCTATRPCPRVKKALKCIFCPSMRRTVTRTRWPV